MSRDGWIDELDDQSPRSTSHPTDLCAPFSDKMRQRSYSTSKIPPEKYVDSNEFFNCYSDVIPQETLAFFFLNPLVWRGVTAGGVGGVGGGGRGRFSSSFLEL